MKRTLFAAISSIVTLAFLCCLVSFAKADDDPSLMLIDNGIEVLHSTPTDEVMPFVSNNSIAIEAAALNVEDFGANGTDDADDADAFIAAMTAAREEAGVTEVYIPAGTYYLGKSIPIFSNTNLTAHANATMISRNSGGIMVYSNHLNILGGFCVGRAACTHGGYTQIENVTIDGGTWDANFSNATGTSERVGATEVFQFRHGRNITIKNAVCKNAPNHFINISGVDTALIENVVFEDMKTFTGSGEGIGFWGSFSPGDPERYKTIEALHVDYIDARGETRAYPLDGTPTNNLVVSNCTFRNVFAGIGTHHGSIQNQHATNLEIGHNTFESVKSGCCINAYGYRDLFVHDNQATDGTTFAFCAEGTTAVITDNTITAMSDNALFLMDGCEATIQGNAISDAVTSGIQATGDCNLSIQNNEIDGAYACANGIVVSDNSCGVIQNNVIRRLTECGIVVSDASGIAVCDNAVSDAADKGIVLEGCSMPQISSNTVNTTGDIGLYVTNSNSAIARGNIVTKSAGNGMGVYRSQDATLTDNQVSLAGGIGIKIHCSSNATVNSNAVSESVGNGIQISGSKNGETQANLTGNSSLSTQATHGAYDIYIGSHCSNCAAKNNVVGPRGLFARNPSALQESDNRMGMGAADLANCEVKILGNREIFVGEKTSPEILVKYCSAALTEGVDYSVSSTFDLENATAQATISGMGSYYGSTTKTYDIQFATPILTNAVAEDDGIELYWRGPNGAKLYRVFRKEDSGEWQRLVDTDGTSFLDGNIIPGKEYTYTVRCLSKDGSRYVSDYDANGISIVW